MSPGQGVCRTAMYVLRGAGGTVTGNTGPNGFEAPFCLQWGEAWFKKAPRAAGGMDQRKESSWQRLPSTLQQAHPHYHLAFMERAFPRPRSFGIYSIVHAEATGMQPGNLCFLRCSQADSNAQGPKSLGETLSKVPENH